MKTPKATKTIKSPKERQKLRFVSAFLCLILCVFCANSCSPKPNDPFSYKSTVLVARVRSVGFDVDFEAVIQLEPYESLDKARFVFEFISPQSLNGLEIRKTDEITKIALDGRQFASLKFPESKSLGLLQIIEMISPSDPIISIKSISGRECGLPDTKSFTAVTTASSVVYIDPESGLPAKASTADGGKHLMINVITGEG